MKYCCHSVLLDLTRSKPSHGIQDEVALCFACVTRRGQLASADSRGVHLKHLSILSLPSEYTHDQASACPPNLPPHPLDLCGATPLTSFCFSPPASRSPQDFCTCCFLAWKAPAPAFCLVGSSYPSGFIRCHPP